VSVATKTEDRLHQLELQLVVFQEQMAVLKRAVEQADFVELHKKLAVLEASVNDLKQREERGETRRWQTVLLFGGSLLTLLVQIIVLFLKK
jgi:hypothetical protein